VQLAAASDAQESASSPTPAAEPEQLITTLEPEPEPAGSLSIEPVQLTTAQRVERLLTKAQQAEQQGRSEIARDAYLDVIDLNPDHEEARLRLAAQFYGRGYASEAIRVLEDGLARNAQAGKMRFLLARIYARIGADQDALRTLEQLQISQLAQRADQLEALQMRAELAQQFSRYADAIADYQQLLERQPDQGRWWLALALSYDDQGDYQAAVEAYQQATQARGLTPESIDYALARQGELAQLIQAQQPQGQQP